MQVSLNTQQNKQNFGMAIYSNRSVDKVLRSRIKDPIKLKLLNDIITKGADNTRVDVRLFVIKNRLMANVTTRDNFSISKNKNFKESIFSGLLGGPLRFIKKVAKFANDLAANLECLY